MDRSANDSWIFPPWMDRLRPILVVLLFLVAPVYAVALVWYGASPKTTDVGYMPRQPVPYSHALHVGELGLDCRYCHNTVEIAAHAAVPPAATCWNCHSKIRAQSETLAPIRDSFLMGEPLAWVRVHDLPDYVYFDHSAHVNRGVSCVECHGRVDRMEEVRQVAPLSMGWCLDCHRNPEPHLRPVEFVTKLDWKPDEDPAVLGARLREEKNIQPPEDCSACHR